MAEIEATFIGHCNYEDSYSTDLDGFLDWLEDEDGEFLAGDLVSEETFRSKLSEWERSKS